MTRAAIVMLTLVVPIVRIEMVRETYPFTYIPAWRYSGSIDFDGGSPSVWITGSDHYISCEAALEAWKSSSHRERLINQEGYKEEIKPCPGDM